ncbi:uncharacterized protein LOC133179138 [Saccostrea echinata]|uniref:uncharacterized protein LOC133179138 n=1 Tax=Saccostrea echinata TaxID=191078 RepID=UPI002A7FB963|nr:uncharacterized protein LOC133179138 [Saccostrea echinata]
MEEDFVSALLRNSGNSPEQQSKGSPSADKSCVSNSYQNLRSPEVSGMWDSTLDISVMHGTSSTQTSEPRWMHDTEYALIAYSIYGCILLVLACIVTALLVVFGKN